jgi:hypothetical protein
MNKDQQKGRKPWFKKWWVWALVVFGLIMAGGALSGGENDSASNKSETASSAKSRSSNDRQLKDSYHVGQVANYKGYKFKVNRVTYYDGSQLDNPKSGNRYVICNVTIKNDTGKKQSYNPMDFQLNANGNSTNMMEILTSEKHSKDTLESGDLDPGASVTGNLIGQAKRGADLKLQYQPSIWNDETVKVALY